MNGTSLESFSSRSVCGKVENFDEKAQFEGFDFYELYDSSKTYETEEYKKDYGKGEKVYINQIMSVNDKNYVYAREEPSQEELKMLEPYCRCYVCTANWYNISKYFACRCCIGCLSAWDIHPNSRILKETREYVSQRKLSSQ
jgi:hypothetical protein